MKLFYKEKLKVIVEERYEQAKMDAMCGLIPCLPPLVKFRNDVVRELFAAEPAKIREEVAFFALKHKQGGRDFEVDNDDNDEGNPVTSPTPSQAEAYLWYVSY